MRFYGKASSIWANNTVLRTQKLHHQRNVTSCLTSGMFKTLKTMGQEILTRVSTADSNHVVHPLWNTCPMSFVFAKMATIFRHPRTFPVNHSWQTEPVCSDTKQKILSADKMSQERVLEVFSGHTTCELFDVPSKLQKQQSSWCWWKAVFLWWHSELCPMLVLLPKKWDFVAQIKFAQFSSESSTRDRTYLHHREQCQILRLTHVDLMVIYKFVPGPRDYFILSAIFICLIFLRELGKSDPACTFARPK